MAYLDTLKRVIPPDYFLKKRYNELASIPDRTGPRFPDAPSSDKSKQLQDENDKLKGEVKKLVFQNRRLKTATSDEALENLDEKIAKLGDLGRLENRLHKEEKEVKKLRAKNADLTHWMNEYKGTADMYRESYDELLASKGQGTTSHQKASSKKTWSKPKSSSRKQNGTPFSKPKQKEEPGFFKKVLDYGSGPEKEKGEYSLKVVPNSVLLNKQKFSHDKYYDQERQIALYVHKNSKPDSSGFTLGAELFKLLQDFAKSLPSGEYWTEAEENIYQVYLKNLEDFIYSASHRELVKLYNELKETSTQEYTKSPPLAPKGKEEDDEEEDDDTYDYDDDEDDVTEDVDEDEFSSAFHKVKQEPVKKQAQDPKLKIGLTKSTQVLLTKSQVGEYITALETALGFEQDPGKISEFQIFLNEMKILEKLTPKDGTTYWGSHELRKKYRKWFTRDTRRLGEIRKRMKDYIDEDLPTEIYVK